DQEEAAATIGASRFTILRRVVLPAIAMPLTTGALLSFARAIGEFGAIVVVAGNIPLRTQTAAVYVFGEIESDNQRGATAMSVVMLLIAFSLVLLVDYLQRRRHE
ncbi:sulfate ABC transporter permease, partial [Kouleothrix aurantiaca]